MIDDCGPDTGRAKLAVPAIRPSARPHAAPEHVTGVPISQTAHKPPLIPTAGKLTRPTSMASYSIAEATSGKRTKSGRQSGRVAVPIRAKRHLLQALIQLANARLKYALDRQSAGYRLLRMSLEQLHEAIAPAREDRRQVVLAGVDLPALLTEVEFAIRQQSTVDG